MMMAMTLMIRDNKTFYLASELAKPLHTGKLHDRSRSDLTYDLVIILPRPKRRLASICWGSPTERPAGSFHLCYGLTQRSPPPQLSRELAWPDRTFLSLPPLPAIWPDLAPPCYPLPQLTIIQNTTVNIHVTLLPTIILYTSVHIYVTWVQMHHDAHSVISSAVCIVPWHGIFQDWVSHIRAML